jgi:hypothetical protein
VLKLEPSLPEDIVQFIRRCINTLGTLDVLLLLYASPARAWTAREVSDELRSSPFAADTALRSLWHSGLVARAGDRFSFQPKAAGSAAMIARLAGCYRDRRTTVITAIFSRPNDAVIGFAEAFRFKKDNSDG